MQCLASIHLHHAGTSRLSILVINQQPVSCNLNRMIMFSKKILLFLLVLLNCSNILMAQATKDYSINWKKVEALEKKGLTKSALEEVLIIYKLAFKDNNDAQQIKSALYQVKYRNMVAEDSREKNIFFVDSLITKAKSPTKNILQSMQAEMFWQYLQQNRYKFYNRTQLAAPNSKDISTWSLTQLHTTIIGLYKASLNNDKLLKSTRIDAFDPILVKGENTRQLRPTLFDFLAFRTLPYFMNDERNLLKPAYNFTINTPNAFAPVAEFVKASFATKDTASLHYHAIELLQQILQFHLNDANKDALLDADIARLNFIYQYAVMENKQQLFEAALKNIETTYAGNPGVAQATYLRANLYYNKGLAFDPNTKTDNQYEIKRAKAICDEVVAKYPATEGGVNSHNLLNQILQPSLNLETEKVNIPGQPFRTLVKYKNAPTVYFRIIKITKDELKKMDRRNYEKLWETMVGLKSFSNWQLKMPDLQDYQQHAAEIKVDALANGIYFILASLDEKFSLQKNILARQLVYISNISYVHNNNNEYNVLNRDNGQPLSNTQVQVWETKYNYNTSQNEEVKAENYTTDKNGYFKLKTTKEYRNYLLQVTTKNDELFMDENNYNNYYNGYEQELKPFTYLFTDRSIYRPGQTIYFKGIVIKKSDPPAATAIIPAFKSTLTLKDVNGQKINELQLTTNEYGSYHGSFKLPEGLLNGQFYLTDESTNAIHYFNVEEYKRPKFYVEILKPAGTYRLLDSIRVTGVAKAYAGNLIDGAVVKYRVVRKVRFPIWLGYSYGRKFMPPGRSSAEMEIANGTATTSSKGEFIIDFKAIPDEQINKKDQPIFYYEATADVTDINGETRSGETSVAVSYQALQLKINIPDKINQDSLKNLKIQSTNINDIFEKTKVNVTIQQLQSPDKIFRARYWEMPDQFIMSKDEYYHYFPYDVYKDENEPAKWPVAQKVSDETDSSQANGEWLAANRSLHAGWYKITATTTDKYGELVKAERIIMINGDTKGKVNIDVINPASITLQQNNVEPGQKVGYIIKSGFPDTWLIHTVSKMDKTTARTYLSVKPGQPYQNEITVNENDRGGIAINYLFVQHNRVYKDEENIPVPWDNKELEISYQTFRDKLLPGSKEKWTAKITGSKGEKLAAEMLVSMYDASLDQFKPQSWSALNVWPGLSNRVSWFENGFSAVSSEELNRGMYDYVRGNPKSYDMLLPGFLNYYGDVVVIGYGTRKKSMERVSEDAVASAAPLQEVAKALRDEQQNNLDAYKPTDTTTADVRSDNIQQDKPANTAIQVRTNFSETAFFFPDLTTDSDGNVLFSFTIPEALTEWKLMTLTHTRNLASGYLEKKLITQKPLMVQPNAPRFMREGDRMEFSAKIVNLSEKEITGTAQLELLDAATNKPVDGWFKNVFPNQYFTVAPGASQAVKFPMEIPFNFNSAMSYRITAISTNKTSTGAETFSDGEEMALPILTNRTLVTESIPLNLRNVNQKDFKFEKLLHSASSNTLSNHALTVEFTANPVWYAVQALPYLMEYPYDCAEQVFNRFYANSLATHVSNAMPQIKAVFERWKNVDTAALMSNLQKNEELKSALLQETPWVLNAQNESLQKQHIALLFDMIKMSSEKERQAGKLKEMQSSNGGFVWFKGGPDDRYMTQYILTGIGHLRKLKALSTADYNNVKTMVDRAIPYLDQKMRADYESLLKSKVNLADNHTSYIAIQYLYMRSFFAEYAVPANSKIAYDYYRKQSQKYWLSNSKYMQAMIALALHRTDDQVTPKQIIQSLKQNAISNEELGMYWKEWTTGGYFWHQAPIESQAMMIEAFTDIDQNTSTINDLKTWLLKQKQTQNWRTTKATAEACYSLLLSGSNWLAQDKTVQVTLGGRDITELSAKTALSATAKDVEQSEAGTGYFKKTITGEKVTPVMGNIAISLQPTGTKSNATGNTAWGAVYWQYFEDLDKITSATTPLQLTKQLFIEKNSAKGPVLESITNGALLKVGDKIKVRIELRVDRDMEYVHMKDMRAACMEPVNVISSYKYQGGLGYYESTKDASTNFFFSWLSRGTYVFEYPMFVTHTGNFSNGITTIQCMYAPEFTSHSEGIRVNVETR